MRIKGSSKDTPAVSGEVEIALIVAFVFLALLVWARVADKSAQEPAVSMGKCGDPGVRCLSELAYAPGERFQVSVTALEVREK